MIPYEIDPSLYTSAPPLQFLQDGYSPVLSMATHPSEPDVAPPGVEPEQQPNPTQLPIEPEFGIALPPAEPEDPGVRAPTI